MRGGAWAVSGGCLGGVLGVYGFQALRAPAVAQPRARSPASQTEHPGPLFSQGSAERWVLELRCRVTALFQALKAERLSAVPSAALTA